MSGSFFPRVGGNGCRRLEERGGRLGVERIKISGTKFHLYKSWCSSGCDRGHEGSHREIMKWQLIVLNESVMLFEN